MSDTDVRNLAGRARRMLVSSVLGTIGAFVTAMLLPQRDHVGYHWHSCMSGGRSIDLAIVIAGAVGLSLACYAVLEAIAHARWRRSWEPVPRARALASTRPRRRPA